MYNISIETNAGDLSNQLSKVVNKQLPFAASKGLNNMVTKIRDNEVRQEYKKVFELRNESFFKNLSHKIFFSNVRQLKRFGVLVASIQRSELPAPPGSVGNQINKDTSFMDLHITGGTRKPLGKNKAVPFSVSSGIITRNKRTGRVVKSKEVKTLYARKDTFTGDIKAGKGVLFQRKKKTIIPLYHFQSSVRNTKKYNPERAVKRGISARVQRELTFAMVKAIKTARIFK